MKVRIDYGEQGMHIEVPDGTAVVRPRERHPLDEPDHALRQALLKPTAGPPLRDLVRPGDSVAISVCDGTRPQPREPMIRAIIAELEALQAANRVSVLVATGTHGGHSDAELHALLGDEIMRTCDVVNHDCRDTPELIALGTVASDVPVALNRRWVEADVRITTGFVEPHFFAGFSGGPKMVAPGLAALETVMALHNAARIGHAKATWGAVDDNPVHEAIRAAASTCPPHFSMDVLLNANKAITHVFSGELWEMHAQAREVARALAMRSVPHRFPVVVTTNSGYPLDQNLYQAVKGMSAAAEIVQPGGTIICAAECREGLPTEGVYANLLRSGSSIEQVDRRIREAPAVIPDQWQVQVQARVQRQSRVFVRADGLTDDQVRAAHLEPVGDIDALIRELRATQPGLELAVLPTGPQTIAYVGGG